MQSRGAAITVRSVEGGLIIEAQLRDGVSDPKNLVRVSQDDFSSQSTKDSVESLLVMIRNMIVR